MFSPFERMVAGRYLRARKAEGFVSVIAGFSFAGIMLGVATLIIVMSVMNGFRQELVTRILGLNGHINVYSLSAPLDDYSIMKLQIGDVPGVTSVSGIIESQALMTINGYSTGVMVRGMTRDDLMKKPVLSDHFIEGEPADFTGYSAAIGRLMSEKLNLKIGSTFTLVSPKAKVTPFGGIPSSRTFTVAMIFDVGMYEYDSNFIFVPLDAAQAFYQMGKAVSSLEIVTKNPQHLNTVKQDISLITDGVAGVYDWRDNNSSFLNALQVERNVMFLILTMIILVAAFNVISSMIMLVKDKGRDIAIMRTMGATRRSMMKIFILTGASIGVVGTFVGTALGIAFALNIESIRQFLQGLTGTELFSEEIYFLSKLPAVIDWNEVIAVIAMAFTLSILATLYPAWRAARLDPVEALRYE
ncbi:lipoprotein-releasing ABC transporter permease subunit [Micavibrio aeruginosavorus]|uniref:lipoprotein-releasing ABC transporter permease subunit n=1 Tax=Micavibrio aeruginosavorus TaxID=349221 RepID=UPI003F4ACB2A